MMNEKLIFFIIIRVLFDEENKEYYLNELYNVYCFFINFVFFNIVFLLVYLYICFGVNYIFFIFNSIENLE